MKRLILGIIIMFVLAGAGFACQEPGCTHSQTQTQTQSINQTLVEGNTTSFSGITGGSLGSVPQSQTASSSRAASNFWSGTTGLTGVGVAGIGQANNSGSGQMNNGIGNQLNNAGTYVENSGAGAGSSNYKYEEARQMAVVMSAAVTSALRFKEGAHQEKTDSRVMSVSEILSYGDTFSYEECKRGRGDVKIIDGLIRSQYAVTNQIVFHSTKPDLKEYRFMGFLTGVAASNDVGMENVVYGVGEAAMEHGATDVVLIKEGATEWGDTTGYAFDVGAFVTSIIGGAGSRSIGPGGTGSAGINGMKGGSADRSDVKFAVFVSNARLQEVSAKQSK